jgi:hypothetical protein
MDSERLDEKVRRLIPPEGMAVAVIITGTLTPAGFEAASDRLRLVDGACEVVIRGRPRGLRHTMYIHECEQIDLAAVEKGMLTKLLLMNV